MKLPVSRQTSIEEIASLCQQLLPQYETEIKKNPLLGFSYVEVRRSGWVGVWINYKPAKNFIRIDGCVPSTMARVFLGGLLLLTINYFASRKIVKETSEALSSLQ